MPIPEQFQKGAKKPPPHKGKGKPNPALQRAAFARLMAKKKGKGKAKGKVPPQFANKGAPPQFAGKGAPFGGS